jgi:hypothetical protein
MLQVSSLLYQTAQPCAKQFDPALWREAHPPD